MRLTAYVIVNTVPLIWMLIGGIFMSAEGRREMLIWVAEYCDRKTRGLHDRVADELDRLSVAGR